VDVARPGILTTGDSDQGSATAPTARWSVVDLGTLAIGQKKR
jgi:hypothetical protein